LEFEFFSTRILQRLRFKMTKVGQAIRILGVKRGRAKQ